MILLIACATAPETAEPLVLASEHLDYDRELAIHDLALEAALERAEARPGWLLTAQAAEHAVVRARLTGDYEDYARADALLSRAEALAPEGSGPHMARARLDFTLHRLDRVEASVASAESALLLDDLDHASFAALRGDVAWQRGDSATALSLWSESEELHPTLGVTVGQAHHAARSLDYERAEALFDEAEAGYHGTLKEPLAWFDLQRGILDLERGRYDEALAHYLDAEADFSGHWLVREHIAEILVLQGRTEEAEVIYLEVVEQTGSPEFMGALAGIELSRGGEAAAARWIARADAAYARQLELFPEAAAGHALEHHLEFGDLSLALELAEANAELRPNAEALGLLAEAQLANGQDREALHTIERALALEQRTADLHLAAAEVFAATGQAGRAQAQLDAALSIHPRALD